MRIANMNAQDTGNPSATFTIFPKRNRNVPGVLTEEETLLKKLDKSIAEVELEEELTAAEEYEEATYYMRTRVRIALASGPQNTRRRFSYTLVDPANHNHEFAHYLLPISPYFAIPMWRTSALTTIFVQATTLTRMKKSHSDEDSPLR